MADEQAAVADEAQAAASESADEQSAPVEPVHCHWCGATHEPVEGESEDWLCGHCERYQDSMSCPTCGGQARVSLMPAEMVPEPAKPRKVKG